jgi:hypothetical protein
MKIFNVEWDCACVTHQASFLTWVWKKGERILKWMVGISSKKNFKTQQSSQATSIS